MCGCVCVYVFGGLCEKKCVWGVFGGGGGGREGRGEGEGV